MVTLAYIDEKLKIEKVDFWPNLDLPDLAEHSHSTHDQYLICRFSGQFTQLRNCFQPGVWQLRRATISISSNIAEGSGRNSNKDKAHFTNIAFSSAIEVLNQLIISQELNFIKTEEYNLVRSKIESITNKLNSLRNYQHSKQ